MKKIIPTMVLLLGTLTWSSCRGAPAEPRQPEDLIGYIESEERAEVRLSWGTEAGQCFTWNDYNRFVHADRPAAVASHLKAAPQFHKLAEMIQAMPPDERNQLLMRARTTAQRTWEMHGEISSAGTTEAGRRAQLLLAESITDAMVEMLAGR